MNTDVGPAAVPAPMNFPDQQPAVLVSMFPPFALASVEVVYGLVGSHEAGTMSHACGSGVTSESGL